jgi:hypothetical protein
MKSERQASTGTTVSAILMPSMSLTVAKRINILLEESELSADVLMLLSLRSNVNVFKSFIASCTDAATEALSSFMSEKLLKLVSVTR